MHRKRNYWLTFSIAVAVSLLLIRSERIAAKPDPRIDWNIPASPYEGYIRGGRDENGQPYTSLYGRIHRETIRQALKIPHPITRWDYRVDFPELERGEVIPVWDKLYEVEGRPQPGGDFLSVIYPKDAKQQIPKRHGPFERTFRDLPQDVIPESNSYTVPLRGYGVLRQIPFKVARIEMTQRDPATAEIRFFEHPSGPEWRDKPNPVVVKKGENLRIGLRDFYVRNVVAPDPSEKLIGWIELDPNPHLPDSPIPSRAKKKPLEKLAWPTPTVHRNFEISSSGWGARWLIHTPWIGEAVAKDPRDFTIILPSSTNYKPQLTPGEKFPLLGHIYEVSPFRPGARHMHEAKLVHPKSLPEGVNCSPKSFAVPLDGYGRIYDTWFRVASFTTVRDASPTGKIEVLRLPPWWQKAYNEITDRQTAKQGKAVKIGRRTYRVENIVPPDPKNKIVGWVEFDPKPVKTELNLK